MVRAVARSRILINTLSLTQGGGGRSDVYPGSAARLSGFRVGLMGTAEPVGLSADFRSRPHSLELCTRELECT